MHRDLVKRQAFYGRFIQPVAVLLILRIVSAVAYQLSRFVGNITLHHWIATISGTGYFASVALGSGFVYAVAFLRGALSGTPSPQDVR